MTTLEGPTWRLARGVDIPDGVEITARFAGGTVSGQAGVNRYRADYRLEGEVFELGPAAATLMAGPPAAMRAEHDYLQLLGGVDGQHVEDDGTLVLTDRAHAPVLWFVAVPPVGDPLAGRWDVRFVRRGEAMVSPTAGSAPYLEFDSAGQVSGSAGVNTLSGPVRSDGDRVHIGPLRTTRMAGPPDAMDGEAALLAALEDIAAWRADADGLALLDADGEVLVQLARSGG